MRRYHVHTLVTILSLAWAAIGFCGDWRDEPDFTIDDVQSQWRDAVGKSLIIHVATRGDINQVEKDLWEVNLWHKGQNLYCQFGRDLFESIKGIPDQSKNREGIASTYLRGTIQEKQLSNKFGVVQPGPCFVITTRLK